MVTLSFERLSFVAFVLITVINQTWGQVGIAYSPFVRDDDNPGSNRYTRADVEVMLKLVEEEGYHEITTYGVGVGSSSGDYLPNKTWTLCASVVHSATAAAAVNKESNSLRIVLYQGLYVGSSTPAEQLNSEIEVGFEMATLANNIFSGTVRGIVFPSIISAGELPNIKTSISKVFNRAKIERLSFGARISDCATLNDIGPEVILSMKFDFIICQMLPNLNHVISGPDNYHTSITRDVSNVKKLFEKNNTSSVKIMLETGWPGGENLGHPNTDVGTMLLFWNLLEKWSKEHNHQIFMHEAFDNPWKRNNGYLFFGDHFGRWKHIQTDNNAKSDYELKKEVEHPDKDDGGPSNELIFGILFGSVLFIVLSVMILFVYRRMKRFKYGSRLTAEEIRQFLDGIVTNEVVSEEANENAWTRIPYNRDFELPKHKFSIDKGVLLGSGAFGSVYKGRIDGLINDVAFKMTRPDCPVSALRGLLSEIKILMYLGKHENVVSICGAYTTELQNGIVYVATELCCNGSLEKYLRMERSSYKTLNEIRYITAPPFSMLNEVVMDSQLMRWALEIASAMEYISSKNIIHADLATRNVLLTLDLTAKVTDFGLSRRLYEYTEYVKKQQEPLPWRWLSPESLARLEFSVKSDVWSFGVTLWELFALGDIPYPGLAWDLNFVNQLESGLRLQRPTRASEQLYEIMVRCWHIQPTNRPSFRVLKEEILALSIQLQHDENKKIIEDLN